MATVLQTLQAHPRVEIVDDERALGNGVIVTLRAGFSFDPIDPENRVAGEDTPSQMLAAVRSASTVAASAIDWNAPIEAFDDEGRVVPLALDPTGFTGANPDEDGDYWTHGNQTGCECWGPDGSGYTNWTVRNVAQVSA